jgi:cell division protein FtsL
VLDQAAARRRTRRRNVLLAAFVIVLAGLFAVAYVHARLVESQQDLDLLRDRIAELEADRAQVERAIDEASAPALIVERAGELGMVPAEDPAFLVAVRETGDG